MSQLSNKDFKVNSMYHYNRMHYYNIPFNYITLKNKKTNCINKESKIKIKKIKEDFSKNLEKDKRKIQVAKQEISKIKEVLKISQFDISSSISFDKFCLDKTECELRNIKEKIWNDSAKQFKLVFNKKYKKSEFKWTYNKEDKCLILDSSFRCELPKWMKIGDKNCWLNREKGIPTGKIMNLILIQAIGLNKSNVEKFEVVVANCQTHLDALYHRYKERITWKEAYAKSKMSKLVAEVANCIGIEQIQLDSVSLNGSDFCSMDEILEESGFTEEQKQLFLKKNQQIIQSFKRSNIHIFHDCESDDKDCVNISFPYVKLTYSKLSKTQEITKTNKKSISKRKRSFSQHRSSDLDNKKDDLHHKKRDESPKIQSSKRCRKNSYILK